MSNIRTWLVTAKASGGQFIDQRRIEALNQEKAEAYAYTWISNVGGDLLKSEMLEITEFRP